MIPTSLNSRVIQKYNTKLTLDLDTNEMIIEKVALIPFWWTRTKKLELKTTRWERNRASNPVSTVTTNS